MSNVVPLESVLSGALVWDGRKRVASVLACDGDGDDEEARVGVAESWRRRARASMAAAGPG